MHSAKKEECIEAHFPVNDRFTTALCKEIYRVSDNWYNVEM